MTDTNNLSHGLHPRSGSEARAKLLEAMLKIKVDPVGRGDTATIVFCGALYGLTLIPLVYAWINRNYYPIRAKKLVLTTLMHTSGILWFLGNICANGLVELVGIWSNCKLWVIWFRILFCFVYSAVLFVRFYALDRVFNQQKPFRGRIVYVTVAAIVAFHLTYAITGQLVNGDHTVRYIAPVQTCDISSHFRYASIGVQWIIWLCVAALMFRLRNIQSSFNEFHESLIIFVIVMALLLETTIVHAVYPQFPLMRSHRVSKTLFDAVTANVLIWVIIAHPVYMCIFHHSEYEDEWLKKLRRDGLHDVYDFTSNLPGGDSTVVSGIDNPGYPNIGHNFINDALSRSRVYKQIESDAAIAPVAYPQGITFVPANSMHLGPTTVAAAYTGTSQITYIRESADSLRNGRRIL
ncbi:hypothetical protein GQ54DRAFT_341515 [Martensiomyces pterosporus]|nr:hypothetical protein GQ54DRAFT_341515 [Martensiomyces pterosporus]